MVNLTLLVSMLALAVANVVYVAADTIVCDTYNVLGTSDTCDDADRGACVCDKTDDCECPEGFGECGIDGEACCRDLAADDFPGTCNDEALVCTAFSDDNPYTCATCDEACGDANNDISEFCDCDASPAPATVCATFDVVGQNDSCTNPDDQACVCDKTDDCECPDGFEECGNDGTSCCRDFPVTNDDFPGTCNDEALVCTELSNDNPHTCLSCDVACVRANNRDLINASCVCDEE